MVFWSYLFFCLFFSSFFNSSSWVRSLISVCWISKEKKVSCFTNYDVNKTQWLKESIQLSKRDKAWWQKGWRPIAERGWNTEVRLVDKGKKYQALSQRCWAQASDKSHVETDTRTWVMCLIAGASVDGRGKSRGWRHWPALIGTDEVWETSSLL